MKRTVTQLGKVGNVVWGKNRFGQTCYELVIPTNPRTPVQQANRGQFGAVSGRWRRLTQEQRDQWEAAGARHQSRRRLGQSGPLSGFNYFVQVNMKRVKRGLAVREVPPALRGRHAKAARAGEEGRNPKAEGRRKERKPKSGAGSGLCGGAEGVAGRGMGFRAADWLWPVVFGLGSWKRAKVPQILRRWGRGGAEQACCYGVAKAALRYPKRVEAVWGAVCPGTGGASRRATCCVEGRIFSNPAESAKTTSPPF